MDDGDQTPITYEEFIKFERKPHFPINPREFTIEPEKGVIEAHDFLQLKVNLLSAWIMISESLKL